MKWILKHYRLFSITAIIAILPTNNLIVRHQHQYPNQSLLETPITMIKITLLLAFILFWLISIINIQYEYTHNSKWKTVYKSNGNNYVSITLFSKVIYFPHIQMYITPEQSRLGDTYAKFENLTHQKKAEGIVTISSTWSIEDKRTFALQGKNIIIEGKLNQNSRITKIEYTPTLKMRRKLFRYASDPIDSNVDGELRITISEIDSWQKRHSMFGD